ncbi:MAG: hypothetical protein IID45_06750 [Planctomycetes bacterium]|nr:hypothetical protein [Planctomycetota bacterium]
MQIFVDGKVIELDDYRRLTVSGTPRKFDPGRIFGRAAQKGHLQELQAFADVIQQGGDWPIPLWQQIQATEISFAVERQLRGD